MFLCDRKAYLDVHYSRSTLIFNLGASDACVDVLRRMSACALYVHGNLAVPQRVRHAMTKKGLVSSSGPPLGSQPSPSLPYGRRWYFLHSLNKKQANLALGVLNSVLHRCFTVATDGPPGHTGPAARNRAPAGENNIT
jgi:hypothetical protein